MKNSCAIILAAGKGTRMGTPYPKVLAELHGKPLVHWAIERMKESGAECIVVVVGYQAEAVKKSIVDAGLDVQFATQKEQLGTGHATEVALKNISLNTQTILVTYGDMPFISANLFAGLLEKQQRTKAAIVLTTVMFDDPISTGFARVKRDEGGQAEKIIEQKVCTDEELHIKECNAGPVAYDAQWLRQSISHIPLSENGEYYLTELVEMARADGKLIEVVKIIEPGHAHGINTQSHLQEAHEIAAL